MLASRAEALRQDYVSRLKAHQETLSDMVRRAQWTFSIHHTDTQPQSALLPLYVHLSGQVV